MHTVAPGLLTLTQMETFQRTRLTRSSNSLRLRRRYSLSSVTSVIFCVGGLKPCSWSSRDSLRICSAVICAQADICQQGLLFFTFLQS